MPWVIELAPVRVVCTVLATVAPVAFVFTNEASVAASVPMPVATIAAQESIGASVASSVPTPIAAIVARETTGAVVAATGPNGVGAVVATETIAGVAASTSPSPAAALVASETIASTVSSASPNAVAAIVASEKVSAVITAVGPNAAAAIAAAIQFPSLSSPIGIYRARVATPGATFVWTDQAGTLGDATQATAANQPTLNAASANFNGKPSLSLDGTKSRLVTAHAVSLVQPITVYAIVRVTNTSAGTVVLFDNLTPSTHFLVGNNNFDWYFAAPTTTQSSTTTTGPMILCAVFNGDSAASALYLNNSTTPIVSGDATHPGTAAPTTTMTIGCLGNSTLFMAGEMTELCFYGAAHTQAQRALMFGWASAEYGFAAA